MRQFVSTFHLRRAAILVLLTLLVPLAAGRVYAEPHGPKRVVHPLGYDWSADAVHPGGERGRPDVQHSQDYDWSE